MIKVPINRRGAPMCAPESLLTAAGITSDRGRPPFVAALQSYLRFIVGTDLPGGPQIRLAAGEHAGSPLRG